MWRRWCTIALDPPVHKRRLSPLRRSIRKLHLSLFSIILLTGCNLNGEETYQIQVGEASLEVEVADTPESRSRGLMFREELPRHRGMLFVFEESRTRSFWMKNTTIPLSIAYIRDDWVVLEIYDMEPESLEAVESRNPVRYALEVNRGLFEELGVEPGDRVHPSWKLGEKLSEQR